MIIILKKIKCRECEDIEIQHLYKTLVSAQKVFSLWISGLNSRSIETI